jgi:hypothetical protein
MSHQDTEDLRTAVAELKELLAPIRDVCLANINRQSNAILALAGLMTLAIQSYGWNQRRSGIALKRHMVLLDARWLSTFTAAVIHMAPNG